MANKSEIATLQNFIGSTLRPSNYDNLLPHPVFCDYYLGNDDKSILQVDSVGNFTTVTYDYVVNLFKYVLKQDVSLSLSKKDFRHQYYLGQLVRYIFGNPVPTYANIQELINFFEAEPIEYFELRLSSENRTKIINVLKSVDKTAMSAQIACYASMLLLSST